VEPDKPDTVIVPEPAVARVPVIPPGEDVAVYSVIVAPPLLAGAVYATVAVVDPVAVAVPIVGAPGTVAATEAVEFEFALEDPATFVAVTTQRIVLPTSAATSVYVLDVAPLIGVVTRCHWYVYVGVGMPDQVPVVQLKVCPNVAVPETTGATVFAGTVEKARPYAKV
jgi:hypothetical protein